MNRSFDIDILLQPSKNLIATPEAALPVGEWIKALFYQPLSLKYRTLTFIIMEEQSRKAIASFCVDDDTAIPPSYARWPYEERVDFADRNSESVVAHGRAVRSGGRKRRNKEGLFRGGCWLGEINLDVGVVRVAESVFWNPSKEQGCGR